IEQIKRDREELRAGRTALASVLLPVVLMGCTVWVGGQAFANVLDRRGEIGILRALGVSSSKVAWLILARALLIGLAGAAAGYAAGVFAGWWWAEDVTGVAVGDVAGPLLPAAALLAAVPLWCGVASLMPALVAARQDPAGVLSEG